MDWREIYKKKKNGDSVQSSAPSTGAASSGVSSGSDWKSIYQSKMQSIASGEMAAPDTRGVKTDTITSSRATTQRNLSDWLNYDTKNTSASSISSKKKKKEEDYTPSIRKYNEDVETIRKYNKDYGAKNTFLGETGRSIVDSLSGKKAQAEEKKNKAVESLKEQGLSDKQIGGAAASKYTQDAVRRRVGIESNADLLTNKELTEAISSYASAAAEKERLRQINLEEQDKKIAEAEKKVKAEKAAREANSTPASHHRGSSTKPNNAKNGGREHVNRGGAQKQTEAEMELAQLRADRNKAESIQYDDKVRSDVNSWDDKVKNLLKVYMQTATKDEIKAAGITNMGVTQNAALVRQQAARAALENMGYDGARLSEMVKNLKWVEEQDAYDAKYEKWAEKADYNPVLASVESFATNIAGGLIGMADLTMQKLEKDINGDETPLNMKSKGMQGYAATQGVRMTVSENLANMHDAEFMGQNVASFLYNTGMSMADSGAIIALSMAGIPPTFGTAMLGCSAAVDSTVNAKARGLTDTQALLIGYAAGVAECVFEKVSLDHFLKTTAPRGTVMQQVLGTMKNIGTQGLVEASEEVSTSIANAITDAVINGDLSEYNTSVRNYQAQGYTLTDAQSMARKDFVVQLATDAAGGFLSGGVFGMFGGDIDSRMQSSKWSTTAKNIMIGMTQSEESEVYKAAERANALYNGIIDKLDSGAKVSEEERASAEQVFDELGAAVKSMDKAELRKAKVQVRAIQRASKASAKQVEKATKQVSGMMKNGETVELEQTEEAKPAKPAYATELLTQVIENPGATGNVTDKQAGAIIADRASVEALGLEYGGEKTLANMTATQSRAAVRKAVQEHKAQVEAETAAETTEAPAAEQTAQTETAPEQDGFTSYEQFSKEFREDEHFKDYSEEEMQRMYQLTKEWNKRRESKVFLSDIGRVVSLSEFRQFAKQAEKQDGTEYTEEEILGAFDAAVESTKADVERHEADRKANLDTMAQNIKSAFEARKLGIDVEVVYGENEYFQAKGTRENAVVVGNKIVFNGNVINSGEAMLYVLGHELVHPGARVDKGLVDTIIKTFQYLADNGIIKGKLAKRVKNIEDTIESTRELYQKHENELAAKENREAVEQTTDKVREEVAADLMREAFASTEICKEIVGYNPGLANKVKDAIRRVKNAITGADGKLNPEAQQKLDDLNKQFDDALKLVAEKNSRFNDDNVEGKVDSGAEPGVPNPSQPQFSLSTWEQPNYKSQFSGAGFSRSLAKDGDSYVFRTGHDVLSDLLDKEGVDANVADRVLTWMDGMADFMRNAGVKYQFINLAEVNNAKVSVRYDTDGKPLSIALSAMVKNGEYPVNFDLTQICNRREAMSKFVNKLLAEHNFDEFSLSKANLLEMMKILSAEGYDTACTGCFVESKRYYMEDFTKRFIKKWNDAVKKINPKADYFNFADANREISPQEIEDADEAMEAFRSANAETSAQKTANIEETLARISESGLSTEDIELIRDSNKRGHEAVDADRDAGKEAKFDSQKYVSDKKLAEFAEPRAVTADELKYLVKHDVFGGKKANNAEQIENLVKSDPVFQRLLTPADIMTTSGLTQFTQLSDTLVSLLSGSYGSGAPKLAQGFIPYNNEIAFLPDKVGKINLSEYLQGIAGLRSQSFSDFKIENVFDYFQMAAELTARHLPAHMYTKELACAKILGMLGVKVNMSVMFNIEGDEYWGSEEEARKYAGLIRDKDGNITYNYADKANSDRVFEETGKRPFIQSIDVAGAFELQDDPRYSKNIGVIGVGYSDEHIRMMLNDPRFRYIIPYHRSSLPVEISNGTNLNRATDYTSTQNTLSFKVLKPDGKGVSMRGKSFKSSAEFLSWVEENGYTLETKKAQAGHGEFDLYGDLEKTNDPKQTAENYKAWCWEHGYLPLFYQFSSEENYYKLLYDFSVYDHEGNYAPQDAVQMWNEDGKMTGFPGDIMDVVETEMRAQNSVNEELWNPEKVEHVVDTIYNTVKLDKGPGQFSLSEADTEYMELAKNPEANRERLQQMVDEAAKKAGYDVGYVVYRGDSAPYNTLLKGSELDNLYGASEFNDDHGNLGDGLYFTPQIAYAERVAGRSGVVRKFYLKADYADLTNPDTRALRQAIKNDIEDEIGYFSRDELYQLLLDEAGKTGIKAKSVSSLAGLGSEEVAVQESWQAKLADPVTYDDNGEVIPLSKRFNTENNDIRYSLGGDKYWKPDLNQKEWNLLNYKMSAEIQSDANFLDSATKWLYAKEKGTTVFALYGIGSGSEPTPLYASGGNTAQDDLAKLSQYTKEVDYDYSGDTFDAWAQAISDAKREYYSVYDAGKHRRKALGLDNILAKLSRSDGVRDSAESVPNRGTELNTTEAPDEGASSVSGPRFSLGTVNGEAMAIVDSINAPATVTDAEAYLQAIANNPEVFATTLDGATEVYLGQDLPGEYTWSFDTRRAGYFDKRAKMQASTVLKDMIYLGENGRWKANAKEKHAIDAANGWTRFDVKFAVPGLNDTYKVYTGYAVIRNDADGKSYLYDVVNVKYKETLPSDRVVLNRNDSNNTPAMRDKTAPLTGDSVAQDNGEVNKNFSLSPADGMVEYNSTALWKESTIDKYLHDYAAKMSPNYAQAYVAWMSPKQFLDLTTSISGRHLVVQESRNLDVDEFTDASLYQPIQLAIDSETGDVVGHEGRHRMVALSNAGIYKVPVLLFDSSNKNSKTHMDEMILGGQDFGSSRSLAVHGLTDVTPFNYANRDAIIEKFSTKTKMMEMGEKYGGKTTLQYSVEDDELKSFLDAYDEAFGEGAYKADFTSLTQQLRAARRARRAAGMAEESKQAKISLSNRGRLATERAWEIYHKRTVRTVRNEYRAKLEQSRKDKIAAVKQAVVVERAKAEVKLEEQELAERMNAKKQAAKRLGLKDEQIQQMKNKSKEKSQLQRNASRNTLKNKRLADKKRAAIETEQGPISTIRENPQQRTFTEKLQSSAENLRTKGRSLYKNFVNKAMHIDRVAKRQTSHMNASVLASIVSSCNSTVSDVYTKGLTDRQGDMVGKSMKEVFLCLDEKGNIDYDKQALFQDYALHLHNVDRMSFVAKARAKLEAFEAANSWLAEMDKNEFARLTAMTEAELEKTGKQRAHDLAVKYSQLLQEYSEATDKPVFPDKNGNPITAETSRQVVAKYEAENPWLKEKAQEMYDWWDQFMKIWVVGDSITQEQYDTMREMYPHYVPTYRVDGKGLSGAVSIGAKGARPGQVVKSAKGGLGEIVNIEDSFANLAAKAVKSARVNELYKNLVDTAMLDDAGVFEDYMLFDWDSVEQGASYATQTGEVVSVYGNGFDVGESVDAAEAPGLVKTKDGYKVSAWYNGRLLSTYVSEDLFTSLQETTGAVKDKLDKVAKVGSVLTNPMKTAITGVNPNFALRNTLRDFPTAVINSVSGLAFPKYWARAWKEIYRSDAWHNFVALGGTNSLYYNTEGGFGKAMSVERGAAGTVKRVWNGTKDVMGFLNETTESVTRFAEYLATIDRMGDTYENRLIGIKNAAEVTVDFSRKGSYGAAINAWVPYWNPAVQGIDKVFRSVFEAPNGKKAFAHGMATLGRAVMTTVLLEAIQQIILAALGRRDDWEELNDRTKDTYYCIPTKDHKFIKIPKNREWGAILGTPLMRLFEGFTGKDDPFENFLETSIIPNFLPGGPTDLIGLSQYIDIATNKDFAGRSIVPYAYTQGSLAGQYDDKTSEMAKLFSKLLGEKLGPMQVDYIIQDYFGDFGDIATMLTAKSTWGEDESVKGILESLWKTVESPWVTDNRYSNADVSVYYENIDELERTWNDKKNHGDGESYKDSIEYKTFQAVVYKSYGKEISEINKQIKDLPDGEKKDELKGQIAKLAGQANEFIDKCLSGDIEAPDLVFEYENLPVQVSDELIRLRSLSDEYSFKPSPSSSKSYVDPTSKVGNKAATREYVLDDEAKAQYNSIYEDTYSKTMQATINSYEYRKASDTHKAEMLEDARDTVAPAVKEEFMLWLQRNRKPTQRKK